MAKKPAPAPPPIDLAALLRQVKFQWSGRYEYNGGVAMSEGRGFVDDRTGRSRTALANPIYNLDEPVLLNTSLAAARPGDDELRFTLHVDVDGPDPLNVVSGTVALGRESVDEPPHFIGRVTANVLQGEARLLTVEDFGFDWPDTADVVNRLEIRLTGGPLRLPHAEARFLGAGEDIEYGPYTVAQLSSFFREVEVEIDREDGALEVEPCDSCGHPDRPDDLTKEDLTFEGAFARAGIRIVRSSGSDSVIDTSSAGDDQRWSYAELHDSMEKYWSAYADKAQWKMWIFLAKLGEDDFLGGVMFDGDIDEPGGVDRQGTTIFTHCPYFHTEAGGYPLANQPADAAVRRELFFNLMHETGHAFNLAHSFQKDLGESWQAPSWMPNETDPQAMSWMNYPDQATPGGIGGANATWFYRRFRFRFDDRELLFLRHAPESYVQMGNTAWFENHGRVARATVDRRLQLTVRGRKQIVELGEPIFLELKLKNVSPQRVAVHHNLDPSDGFVQLAVTGPRGERRPFVPIAHARCYVKVDALEPGKSLFSSVNLTMGNFGFHFKEPGAYRIEASYHNLDGATAAGVMQLYVRPPASFDDLPVIHELWNARVGRAIYVGGTRVMEDVNDKLDWVQKKLPQKHPLCHFAATVRYQMLATATKVIDPASHRLKVMEAEPDRVVEKLQPLMEKPAESADVFGHIRYHELVDTFTRAAVEVKKQAVALDAQKKLLSLFKKRDVVAPVLAGLESMVKSLR